MGSSSSAAATGVFFLLAVLALLVLLAGSTAEAVVFHSQKDALALAFPSADRIETDTYLLTEQQVAAVQDRARAKLDSRIAKFYVGWQAGERVGYAYIDVHTVRTMPEAFLVVLDLAGNVRSLRVLAFHEPLDYLPTERWFEQFQGRSLLEPLRVGRDVHGIMGATISARAVTRSVRKVLALYQVLFQPAIAPE